MIIGKQQQIKKKKCLKQRHTLRLYWISCKRSLKGFFWGGGSVYGSDTESGEGDWGTEDKDFYFQFDDSDADFLYLD